MDESVASALDLWMTSERSGRRVASGLRQGGTPRSPKELTPCSLRLTLSTLHLSTIVQYQVQYCITSSNLLSTRKDFFDFIMVYGYVIRITLGLRSIVFRNTEFSHVLVGCHLSVLRSTSSDTIRSCPWSLRSSLPSPFSPDFWRSSRCPAVVVGLQSSWPSRDTKTITSIIIIWFNHNKSRFTVHLRES